MAGTLTPTPYQTVLDADGVAVSGALIYTYVGGTTTAATTYADASLATPNPNPVVADSAGRFVAYLPAGGNFKFTYKTAAGATIEEQDNILSVPGSAVNLDIEGTVGEAVTAGQVVYLSSGAESPALTAGSWYLADADLSVSSTLPQSVGIAVSAIAINTAGTIRLAGTVTTASAVVVGSTYYVSATAGALTATPPVLSRQVGVALTTSSLLMAGTTAISVLPNPISQDVLFVDATYDIGKAGANRPRDFFQSRNATIGGTLGVTGATTLSSTVGTGALAVTGTATVSSTLVVTGATTLSTLGVTGVTTLTGGLNTPLTVPNGGTGVATQQAYGVLVGGTTATGAMQSITPGTSTKVLTSAGTGALPTWSQPSNLTQSFRSLTVRTSPNADVAATTVTLDHADEIVMQDGVSVSDWNDLTANIAVSGAGGLDTGSEGASRWYSIHAIRKSSDGTKNLLLHRAKSYDLDANYTTTNTSLQWRMATSRTKVAQGIKTTVTGYVPFVDVQLLKNLSPTGNMWLTLETDSGGYPSGTALATSNKQDVSLIAASAQFVRFVFPTPASLTATTQYHIVMQADYTASDTVNLSWYAHSVGTYTGGQAASFFSGTWGAVGGGGYDFVFKTYVTQNDTALTMPSGYDQYAQVGWVYNNSSSNFLAMRALDGEVSVGAASLGTFSTTLSTLTDLSVIVPPVSVVAKIVASLSGATDISLSAMPDLYYDLAGTDPRNLLTLPTASRFYGAMYLGLTMEQAAYFLNNNASGTITAYCSGFKW